ncbi:TonB-dependent siderophore receptor [Roseococcus sp. YIM B11640]|uniref:TonB-dependent siderophore receptor n=1 Tax=Roseococcus sp. YIM B11640 TaxID=3133973 RepID=UPI003C7B7ECF
MTDIPFRHAAWLPAVALMAFATAAQAQPAEGASSVELPLLSVEGAQGTARGPVTGYIAPTALSGTKTDTSLLETPQSVSVITRDRMDTQNVQSLGQAFRYSAGTHMEQYGEDTRGEYFTIRGFAADVYLDGLRAPASSGYGALRIEPWGMERIEVLRGANSGLYGQGGPGGIVNGISRTPNAEMRNTVTGQTGSFNRLQGAFDLGGAVNADGTIRWRMNGLVRNSDTQADNVLNNRYYIAPSVRWQPNAQTSLTLLGSLLYDDTGSSAQFLPPRGTVLYNPNGRISRSLNTGDPDFDKFYRRQATLGYMLEHRPADNITLRQNMRYTYQSLDYLSIYPAAASITDRRAVVRGVGNVQSAFNNISVDNQAEFRFGTGPLQHTVLAGLDYRWQFNANRTATGTGPGLDFFTPTYGVPIMRPSLYRVGGTTLSVTNNNQFLNQLGLYAQDQIRWGNWQLTLTGRQDYASVDTRNNLTGAKSNLEDSAFTGRVGLLYAAPIGISPYVSYATSFNPSTGTYAPQRGGGTFEPTRGEQVEIGIKFQPRGMNSFVTAAAYDLRQTNVSTADPVYTGYNIQSGEVRVRGLELEATMNLMPGLNVIGAVTYQEPEITQANNLTRGNRPVAAPNHFASLWADYTWRVNDDLSFGFGSGVRYVGNTLGNNSTGSIYHVPSYTLVDAMARADYKNWRLQLNATNLGDEYYVAACSGGANCAYGIGRSIYATLAYRW